MIDFNQVKSDAVGRWPVILSRLGIDAGDGKHKPCPVCGGKDRFRFDDKNGRGTWICNQCGSGDGIGLIKSVLNLEYADAMQRVADIVGHVDRIPRQCRPRTDVGKNRMRLIDLWESSQALSGTDPVSKYLRGRGLLMATVDVRFCPDCYESETKSKMPAMVAKVRNAQGRPVSIHRTYLNGTGKAPIKSPKKMMPRTEPLAGAAIRLFKTDDTVGVAEGIETAMAATQLFGTPTWATISSTLMESFEPPDDIRRVIVFGDCDANFTGQAAAYKLAKRLYLKDHVVDVKIPDRGDWADQIERTRQRKESRR